MKERTEAKASLAAEERKSVTTTAKEQVKTEEELGNTKAWTLTQ